MGKRVTGIGQARTAVQNGRRLDAVERTCDGMVRFLVAAVVIVSISLALHGKRHTVSGGVAIPRNDTQLTNSMPTTLPALITHSRLSSELARQLR